MKATGYRTLMGATLLLSSAFTGLTPWVSSLAARDDVTPACKKAVVFVFHLGAMWPVMFSFTCVFVLINNSAVRARRGWLNGVGQALVALARVVGPVFVGNVFAWSEHRGGAWPFNFHLTFYLLTLVGLGAAALTLLVPESCERQQLAEAAPPEDAMSEMAAVGPAAPADDESSLPAATRDTSAQHATDNGEHDGSPAGSGSSPAKGRGTSIHT